MLTVWETINIFPNWGYSPNIYDRASEEEKKNMDFEEVQIFVVYHV